MTVAIWFLGFSILILALMLAPWAVNEADKIKDAETCKSVCKSILEEDSDVSV